MKTWPIDPLGLRNVQLEVSEKLPQVSVPWCTFNALLVLLSLFGGRGRGKTEKSLDKGQRRLSFGGPAGIVTG